MTTDDELEPKAVVHLTLGRPPSDEILQRLRADPKFKIMIRSRGPEAQSDNPPHDEQAQSERADENG